MEEDYQIKPLTSFTGIVATLIPLNRFIEPLMRSKGIEVLQKVVLQVDDAGTVESLMGYFRNLGAAIDTNASAVKNFQCYVVSTFMSSKPKIMNLLKREDLFLIIIVQGIVPAYLSDCCTIQLDTRLHSEEAEFLAAEARKFMDYARKNPCLLLQALDNFITSTWYTEYRFSSILNVSLHAVLETYRVYYRGEHCEADTMDWMDILEAGVECIIDRTEGIGCDVMRPIRTLVNEYLETHPEVLLCNIEEVEGQTLKALECDQAILYDNAYYYLPERLFRFMCEPLQDIVSIIEIKSRLLYEEYLDCDKGSSFTVKKVIVSTYGQRLRMRFLKIFRNFIVEDGSLAPEERRWVECTSGGSRENGSAIHQETLPMT